MLTLQWTISGLLDGHLNFIVASSLLNADSEVDNGDILSWNTERHSGKLAIEMGNDFANSLFYILTS